jgi:hypothetical protein
VATLKPVRFASGKSREKEREIEREKKKIFLNLREALMPLLDFSHFQYVAADSFYNQVHCSSWTDSWSPTLRGGFPAHENIHTLPLQYLL